MIEDEVLNDYRNSSNAGRGLADRLVKDFVANQVEKYSDKFYILPNHEVYVKKAIFYIIRQIIERRARKRDLSANTIPYLQINAVVLRAILTVRRTIARTSSHYLLT